jgi:hypothetical protein
MVTFVGSCRTRRILGISKCTKIKEMAEDVVVSESFSANFPVYREKYNELGVRDGLTDLKAPLESDLRRKFRSF